MNFIKMLFKFLTKYSRIKTIKNIVNYQIMNDSGYQCKVMDWKFHKILEFTSDLVILWIPASFGNKYFCCRWKQIWTKIVTVFF